MKLESAAGRLWRGTSGVAGSGFLAGAAAAWQELQQGGVQGGGLRTGSYAQLLSERGGQRVVDAQGLGSAATCAQQPQQRLPTGLVGRILGQQGMEPFFGGGFPLRGQGEQHLPVQAGQAAARSRAHSS